MSTEPKDVQKPVHCSCDVELYCEHVLERFQPCGPSNYSDPFHGPVGLRIQSNDFTEKVLSHQICEKLLWGFFLHQCSQLLPEEPWGFGQEKKKNRTTSKKEKKNLHNSRLEKDGQINRMSHIENPKKKTWGTNHMMLATSITTALTKKYHHTLCPQVI